MAAMLYMGSALSIMPSQTSTCMSAIQSATIRDDHGQMQSALYCLSPQEQLLCRYAAFLEICPRGSFNEFLCSLDLPEYSSILWISCAAGGVIFQGANQSVTDSACRQGIAPIEELGRKIQAVS